jgi:hypothetical protein
MDAVLVALFLRRYVSASFVRPAFWLYQDRLRISKRLGWVHGSHTRRVHLVDMVFGYDAFVSVRRKYS